MQKLSKQEKHKQNIKEIKATLVLALICFLWHVLSAFILNHYDLRFLCMPAWFSVSTLGTIVLAVGGVIYLSLRVFVDYEYVDEISTKQEVENE